MGDCPGDVLTHERSVQCRRKLGEHLSVRGDQTEERGSPRVERHDVPEEEIGEIDPFTQVCSEGDRAAHVVGDDVRPIQTPCGDQLGEAAPLGAQIERDPRRLGRCAVPRHIPEEDPVPSAQCRGDGAPDLRRPRSTVAEHDISSGGSGGLEYARRDRHAADIDELGIGHRPGCRVGGVHGITIRPKASCAHPVPR